MLAVQFDRFGPPDVLNTAQAPEPHAGPREIRIAVRAAGVSPVDVALRAGTSPSRDSIALPHIPGFDAAGVVDEVGAEVTDVRIGDEVFGIVDLARLGGATGEHAVLAAWATRPPSMPWPQAGAAGTSVETATRALDRLAVEEGSTLLIDGATGGVGSVAVQLAIARGAEVIGTARPESGDFVEELGATPVAYGPGLPDRVAGLGPSRPDAALDVAGRGSLAELVALTGSPASVLTLADFGGPALGVAVSLGALAGEPGGHHGLAEAARLFSDRRFYVPIEDEFPVSRAAAAHAAAEVGPRRGKIVLVAGDDWT